MLTKNSFDKAVDCDSQSTICVSWQVPQLLGGMGLSHLLEVRFQGLDAQRIQQLAVPHEPWPVHGLPEQFILEDVSYWIADCEVNRTVLECSWTSSTQNRTGGNPYGSAMCWPHFPHCTPKVKSKYLTTYVSIPMNLQKCKRTVVLNYTSAYLHF